MSRLTLSLFGPPLIELDGNPVTTDTRKAVALLAYLAMTRQTHSRDTLAALLWPEYDQPHARATLRRTLSSLHKALAGAWLQIDRETIGLKQQDGFWLDVEAFRSLLTDYHTHQHQAGELCTNCLAGLNRAVTLYRDSFMAGFSLSDSAPFDDWQFYQADSLRREFAGALEQLILAYIASGEIGLAITQARRLLSLDRLHEPAHRYLMQLYAWSGQRSAAIQQYQECVKALDEELGVAPLEATIQLYGAIKENRLSSPPERRQPFPPNTAAASHALPLEWSDEPHLASFDYPLVGRENEWAELLSIYAEKALSGYIVALEGEAGIGKTRLAEDLVAETKARGARTVSVRCYEGEIDLAYGPIAAGLRVAINQQQDSLWLAQLAPHWLSEATRLLPELAQQRLDVPSPQPLASPGAQSRFFEGLRQVLLALCSHPRSTMPGILFFDDIHWADAASLEFLGYLIRRLDEKPLCLLLTWRNNQQTISQRFQRPLAEAQQSGKARLLTLARLDQPTVERLIRHIAPSGVDLPPHFTSQLYQETEGVPLFLTEYLTALTTRAIKAEDTEWSLPGGVRNLLNSRLEAVGETSRQLLGTAATIGRSFDFDTLCEVSGRSEEETVNGLEELISMGLVKEMGNLPTSYHYSLSSEPTLSYDFCHEKMRSLVYDGITLARRRLLHRRTAETLVARMRGQRELGILAGQIALHYQAADRRALAATYFCQAGVYAHSLYRHTEALAHFHTALALGHPTSSELLETIADLYTFLGEYEAALQSYRAAKALSATPRAILEQKQGKIYERRGNWQLAEEHFALALHLLQTQARSEEEQARVCADWSLSAHHHGHIQQAHDLAQQALDLAEQANDTHALAQAHNMLGILANSQGEMTRAYFHLERSLALAENLQDASIQAAALNNLALAYRASGEIVRAIALTETALALCRSQGDRHREAALHSNLADLLHEAERTNEAMSQLKLAARIYTEIDGEAGTMQPEIWKLVEW